MGKLVTDVLTNTTLRLEIKKTSRGPVEYIKQIKIRPKGGITIN